METLELPDVLTISLTAASPRCLQQKPTVIRMMVMLLLLMLVMMMMMMMMMMFTLPAATTHNDLGATLGEFPSSLEMFFTVPVNVCQRIPTL